MSRQDLISFAKAATLAYNDKDWDKVRDTIDAGYVYDEVATGRRVEGADAVIRLWKGWAEAFPDARATIQRALVDGSRVVLELEWAGTHQGPLRMPSGEIPPTGKSIRFRACEIVEVEGEKGKSAVHYFDLSTMLNQLGVSAAGAPGMAATTAARR